MKVRVDVSFGTATIAADREDIGNALVDRVWSFSAPVRAPGCRVTGRETFDGRPAGHANAYLDRGTFYASGYVGDLLTLRARCAGGSPTHTYAFPMLRCEGGTVPVVALHGRGTMEDNTFENRAHVLRAGDVLHTDGQTTVHLTGTARLASPECNGFRVTLFAGTSVIGGYDAYGRGAPFRAEHIVLRGDRHAGSILIGPTAKASTEDAPCRWHCAPPPPPSTVEVLRTGSTTLVRAEAGAATVRTAQKATRLVANEQVHVTCRVMTCSVGAPELVQPGEPLVAHMTRFARFAPRYATIDDHFAIARSAREPAELVVAWDRLHLASAKSPPAQQQGVTVWTHSPSGWRRADHFQENYAFVRVFAKAGDVTHDGHADVVEDAMGDGTAGCRFYRVVATIEGHVRVVYERRNICEAGGIAARGGNLDVTTIVGPCPYRGGSVHCYGGTRTQTLRWDGRRFRVVGVMTRCVLPRLDPRDSCR